MTGTLSPALTAYDLRILRAVESEKARSTWYVWRSALRGLASHTVVRAEREWERGWTEGEIALVLSGLAHLGYVERVAFGRWRRTQRGNEAARQ